MSGGTGFKVFVALHMVDYASRHMTHFASLAANAGKNINGINKALGLMGGVAAVAIGGAATGAMIGFVKHTVDAGEELERMKMKLEGVGKISASQRKAILGDIRHLTNQPFMLTQAEGIKTAIDLHTVLGDVHHARQALPQAMALKSALGVYFKDMNTEQVYDAYRGAELASAQGSKPATMSAIMGKVDALTRIVVGTGGKVDYQQLHSFMRMNKNLRTTMSDEGMYGMARVIQEMGGAQAGTALQALGRAGVQGKFGSSTQGKAYIAQWARMGLLDSVMLNGKTLSGGAINPDALEARGSKVRDVRIKDLQTLMSDPAKWGATTFTGALAARGINTNDNAAVMKAIGPMTGNQNLAQILSMLVTQRGAIAKDRDIVRASADSGRLYGMTVNSYPGQKQMFGKNIEKLMEAVGSTLVPLVKELLQFVNPLISQLTAFIKEHPTITRFVVVLGLVGAAFVTIAGLVAIAVVAFGSLSAGLAAIGAPIAAVVGGAGTLVLALGGLATAIAGVVAVIPNVNSWAAHMTSDAKNPNTPEKMRTRAAEWQKANAEKIKRQNASIGPIKPGSTRWKSDAGGGINIHVHGITDPKEVARVVESKLASLGKNLNVPTSGYGHYQGTGFMSA